MDIDYSKSPRIIQNQSSQVRQAVSLHVSQRDAATETSYMQVAAQRRLKGVDAWQGVVERREGCGEDEVSLRGCSTVSGCMEITLTRGTTSQDAELAASLLKHAGKESTPYVT